MNAIVEPALNKAILIKDEKVISYTEPLNILTENKLASKNAATFFKPNKVDDLHVLV